MADQCSLRLVRELAQFERSEQLAFTVAYDENNTRDIQALIIGPPGTPYELGFYEFAIRIPSDYPASPPVVRLKTTNRGRTRFGPNLYASGRVCLSILGTWPGDRGEEWSPAQGLESVLLSIQSLLSSNPYILEPGFDTRGNDTENMEAYNSKIRHENLRLAVIAPLEKALQFPFLTYQHISQRNDQPPVSGAAPGDRRGPDQSSLSAFADFSKQRFLWYLDLYKNAIEKGIVDEARRHKTPFIQMPFEGVGNIMQGTWDYTDLKARLASVQGQLMQETHKWPVEGLALVKEDAGIAVKLMGQHEQIVAELKSQRQVIDLSLADGNPFVWRLTYVGRTESRLEGGIIKIKIFISPRHPVEQPRVFVESPLYHIRVSKLGVMIYLPARADDIRHHIDGIINTLEDDNPPYNPLMTVNPEASALCWGTEVERRLYRRKLRASLEAS
ncbi:hypothetical protein N7499_004360 [Penicillium canescens]|uniref:Ubiquitin-conjugating enzyme E2 Z n=1 Tax=Penicillium canescens TaxID=5083 RepID=A0AAD6I9R2_PENCN|nr:uncharacterized protein N7446_005346 [Penicillium canescens]KAJ6038542.1 hypothetical protein N7460_008313 [Penicillium canescens]KAJ6039397.1 hypothetical protein N7444_008302 [Penicillium canescens]KAJ6068309.1 hypothetical protein N7446_005346 [Penicillium canescens]KAJ6084731.1 hypothetical protein N7499_004360 [Penicillium canescens]KAJ6161517.1 hypothetical protein N7485_009747 [Penicillium canescens]